MSCMTIPFLVRDHLLLSVVAHDCTSPWAQERPSAFRHRRHFEEHRPGVLQQCSRVWLGLTLHTPRPGLGPWGRNTTEVRPVVPLVLAFTLVSRLSSCRPGFSILNLLCSSFWLTNNVWGGMLRPCKYFVPHPMWFSNSIISILVGILLLKKSIFSPYLLICLSV